MHIVAAGMHHRFTARRIDSGRRVGESGLLTHRQRVHIRAEQHHRTGPIHQSRNHTRPADALGHLESERPRAPSDDPRGAMFGEG